MDFRIIEQLGHPARKSVGLWLSFSSDGNSKYMLKGGEIIEVEQTYQCLLDPTWINSFKADLEAMESEVKFLRYIDLGTMGYVHQQDPFYGVIQKRHTCPVLNIPELRTTRQERIDRLQELIGELRVDIHRCADMLWLMEAGKIFDKERDQEKKSAWLLSVRNEKRPISGEQQNLF